MFYEPGSSLNLDLFVDHFEEDRERYWGDAEQDRTLLAFIDSLAKTVLQGAEELIEPPRDYADPTAFNWEQVRHLMSVDGLSPRIMERIEIEVARQYCVDTRAMAARCLELVDIVITAQPNEAVLRFLRRLSRCYIAGFLPECVMLCRAVVENALTEKYARKRVPLPATPEGQSSMRARLDSAVRFSLMERGRADEAWIIWKRGSKAAHEDPEATRDVLGTIKTTMGVLEDLYA